MQSSSLSRSTNLLRGKSAADGWAHNPEVGGSSPPLRNQYISMFQLAGCRSPKPCGEGSNPSWDANYSSLVQRYEQLFYTEKVVGSIPTRATNHYHSMETPVTLTPYSIKELYKLHQENPNAKIVLIFSNSSGIGVSIKAKLVGTLEVLDLTDYDTW